MTYKYEGSTAPAICQECLYAGLCGIYKTENNSDEFIFCDICAHRNNNPGLTPSDVVAYCTNLILNRSKNN